MAAISNWARASPLEAANRRSSGPTLSGGISTLIGLAISAGSGLGSSSGVMPSTGVVVTAGVIVPVAISVAAAKAIGISGTAVGEKAIGVAVEAFRLIGSIDPVARESTIAMTRGSVESLETWLIGWLSSRPSTASIELVSPTGAGVAVAAGALGVELPMRCATRLIARIETAITVRPRRMG